jgi:toxin FitB
MGYLLDTCVISELVKKQPDKKVTSWLSETPNESLYISVLTLGEIRKGTTMVNDVKKREHLLRWLEKDLLGWFGDRVIPVDLPVADRWGRLVAEAKRQLPAIDSLLAATALSHNLRMVTRNEKDFQHATLEVINPWV